MLADEKKVLIPLTNKKVLFTFPLQIAVVVAALCSDLFEETVKLLTCFWVFL